jgi:predicted RNase H-like nuclease (RuvC/YqgF family)
MVVFSFLRTPMEFKKAKSIAERLEAINKINHVVSLQEQRVNALEGIIARMRQQFNHDLRIGLDASTLVCAIRELSVQLECEKAHSERLRLSKIRLLTNGLH